jgi:endonuclease/exonuclease/phosphatase family metal-dependent hydrolase
VLGADVNEEPGGAAWRRLGAGLTDTAGADRSPTYPTSGPRRRIDAVFADPRVLVTSYAVLDDDAVRRASDHLPVVVTLTDER